MPTQISEASRQSLVDDVMARVDRKFEEEVPPLVERTIAEKAVPRDEYRQVLSRLDVLEHDVADIKVDVRSLRSEMREEIGSLRVEMGDLRSEMNERFDRVNERFDRMNERFVDMERHFESRFDEMSHRMLVQTRWMIGSIALFGTIITVLLAIAQFTA